MTATHWFSKLATAVSHATGRPWAFAAAVLMLVAWAASGPLLHYSDTWQLSINTATTILTFLMVFVIQNTQNRDNLALQIKVDELLRATSKAHDALLDLEELTDRDLERIKKHYAALALIAREALAHGDPDTDLPEPVLEIPPR
jgi:low affinity Fe/Cu permease